MDINTFPPMSGRILGEDGQTHNLVDLLTAIADSDKMMLAFQPHLWQTGVEYDFGNGTFGRRFIKDTYTENLAIQTLHPGISGNLSIVACGGYVEFGTFPNVGNPGRLPVGQTFSRNAVQASSAMFAERTDAGNSSDYALYLCGDTNNTSQTAYKYDVWVRYKK
jgi:hypothetical protein